MFYFFSELQEENARLKAELDEVREDFSIEKDKKTTYSYEVRKMASFVVVLLNRNWQISKK